MSFVFWVCESVFATLKYFLLDYNAKILLSFDDSKFGSKRIKEKCVFNSWQTLFFYACDFDK
jgi:hypothetical protein